MNQQTEALPTLVERTTYIISLDDQPVLRNLLITQCYHDLAQAQLTELFGSVNLDWCHFATWASKTAGGFIREDEILAPLKQIFLDLDKLQKEFDRLNQRVTRLSAVPQESLDLLALPEVIAKNVSNQIMEGNLKVFAELGPLFAKMIDTFKGSRSFEQAILNQLIDPLKTGATEDGGQDNLKKAFTHYYRAMFTEDPHERAQLMLLANGLTGYHEQIRLQSYIAGSLTAPIKDIIRAFARKRVLQEDYLWTDEIVQDALNNIVTRIEKVWIEFATDVLMTLKTPTGTLRLGSDLPALPNQPLYPLDLQKIDMSELEAFVVQFAKKMSWLEKLVEYGRKLLAKFGFSIHVAPNSGAENWTDLHDRMNYIVTLFRSRQQVEALQEQPFTDAQHQAILENKVPTGPL